jgi:hypothetical protein
MRCGQSPYHIRIWGWRRRSEIALSDRCALWPRGRRTSLPSGVWSGLRTRLALLLLGARARTACVSNIEQLPQVCSAMIVGGVMAREACAPAYTATRSAMMASFLPFLIATKNLEISDRSFDAETMGIIGDAFDKACKEMHDQTQPDSLQESIAGRLIDIAARGERDPKKMCESALISLGLAPNRFTIRRPQISPLRARFA